LATAKQKIVDILGNFSSKKLEDWQHQKERFFEKSTPGLHNHKTENRSMR
jgi:hypothetical protein